jgi:hypothetical protein
VSRLHSVMIKSIDTCLTPSSSKQTPPITDLVQTYNAVCHCRNPSLVLHSHGEIVKSTYSSEFEFMIATCAACTSMRCAEHTPTGEIISPILLFNRLAWGMDRYSQRTRTAENNDHTSELTMLCRAQEWCVTRVWVATCALFSTESEATHVRSGA